MKKILCPVDFSASATNGMEYAAKLAKDLSAQLTLLYVRPSIWPEAIQLEQEVVAGLERINEQLQVFSTEVHNEFGILCDNHVEQTTDTLEMAIATEASNYDLIVMGTNGADNLYQYVLGSNAFHVIEQVKCPVIVVPEGCVYQPLKLIVYAYDPETNPIFLIEQLKSLAFPLNAEVRVLYISTKKHTTEEAHKMEILMDALKARETRHISWSIDFQNGDDVADALDTYLHAHPANMLALSCHHQSWIEKIFETNIVRQISMVADYPVLAFWH